MVRGYGRLLNLVLPDPKGLEFVEPYKRLVQIRQAAYRVYYDRRLRPREFLPQLMGILNEAVKVGELDLTEPAEITSDAFLDELKKEPHRTKVTKTASALGAYIDAHIYEDPAFYQPLQKQLEQILEKFRQKRLEAQGVVEQLLSLRDEILKRTTEAERLGLSQKQLPFFNAIEEAAAPDWTQMEPARQRVRAAIYRCLKKFGIPREKAEQWQTKLLELAELHFKEV